MTEHEWQPKPASHQIYTFRKKARLHRFIVYCLLAGAGYIVADWYIRSQTEDAYEPILQGQVASSFLGLRGMAMDEINHLATTSYDFYQFGQKGEKALMTPGKPMPLAVRYYLLTKPSPQLRQLKQLARSICIGLTHCQLFKLKNPDNSLGTRTKGQMYLLRLGPLSRTKTLKELKQALSLKKQLFISQRVLLPAERPH